MMRRNIFIALALVPGLLACGGTTTSSPFAGTWSCVLDSDPPHALVGTVVANADGTLTVTGGLAPGECTTSAQACEWPVVGSVATAPPALLNPGPPAKFDSETLTFDGDSMALSEYLTYDIDDIVPVHLTAMCTKS